MFERQINNNCCCWNSDENPFVTIELTAGIPGKCYLNICIAFNINYADIKVCAKLNEALLEGQKEFWDNGGKPPFN